MERRAMAEPETFSPEIIAEDEPRYLRRQKPLEIRRRKFGRRSWRFYGRVLVGAVAALVGGWLLYQAARFFLFSPRVILADLGQIELSGNQYVSRSTVLERFAADRGRSVLRVPLEERRKALEEIPWVERAGVERILPNRIRVELQERAPVAFLRSGTELALIDAHGVVLERPLESQFRFPVVSGLGEAAPRAPRMQLYVQFLNEIELVRPGATDHVSEVDLSDEKDLRAVLSGLARLGASGAAASGPVLVHFGEGDFVNKFRLLVENMSQWQAAAGRVDSVDLRFARQVVVNPDARAAAARAPRGNERDSRAR